jgi:hypothetical protein
MTEATPFHFIKGSAVLASLLLTACAPPLTENEARRESNRQALEEAAPRAVVEPREKPDVAFMIEEGLYAVPLAVDEDGCEQFTTWSDSGARRLTQPTYFHDGEGSFSPEKAEAFSCNAEMIRNGPDETGCPTFLAEQPDGSSSEAIYYRGESGFTARRERAICDLEPRPATRR